MIRLLIALFPKHFRQAYGDDMRDVFTDQLRAARTSGRWAAVAALWLRTIVRMSAAAFREHRASRRVSRGTAVLDFFRYDLRLTGRALARSPLFTTITMIGTSDVPRLRFQNSIPPIPGLDRSAITRSG